MTTVESLGTLGEARELADLLDLYRQMRVIRAVEKKAYDLFLHGLVKGTTHMAAGHEAVAVGSSAALRPDDYVWATYRGHHHFLARGGTPLECFAELMGREAGACRGKGGSMHLGAADRNMMGSYAIIGAQLAMACGTAWSAVLRKSEQVTLAFHGDGATNIGAFHESLNLAAIWRLPVVFVCENNLYMEYTRIADVIPVTHPAADRASAYAMPAEVVDGNDVIEVRRAVTTAVSRARAGEGPSIVEAMTYRHYGHSRTDPAHYRPAKEVEQWLQYDPLKVTADQLRTEGATAEQVARIHAEIDNEIGVAVEEAKASPAPERGEALTDMWADGGSQWRR